MENEGADNKEEISMVAEETSAIETAKDPETVQDTNKAEAGDTATSLDKDTLEEHTLEEDKLRENNEEEIQEEVDEENTEVDETEEEKSAAVKESLDLQALQLEKVEAEKKNVLLNKKVVEYFRRRKETRFLVEDDANQVNELTEHYHSLLRNVAELKNEEERFHNESTKKIGDLRQEESEISNKVKQKHSEFIQRLKDVGLNTRSVETGLKLKEQDMEKHIEMMERMRNKICDARLSLIKVQNTANQLRKKSKEYEKLDGGITINEIEQRENDCLNLTDKIDERSAELFDLRRQYTKSEKDLLKYKENECELDNSIILHQRTLENTQNHLVETRKKLLELKKEHDTLRKIYSEIKFNSDVLGKPSFVYEYYKSMENIEKLKIEAEELKQEKLNLLTELGAIEKK